MPVGQRLALQQRLSAAQDGGGPKARRSSELPATQKLARSANFSDPRRESAGELAQARVELLADIERRKTRRGIEGRKTGVWLKMLEISKRN